MTAEGKEQGRDRANEQGGRIAVHVSGAIHRAAEIPVGTPGNPVLMVLMEKQVTIVIGVQAGQGRGPDLDAKSKDRQPGAKAPGASPVQWKPIHHHGRRDRESRTDGKEQPAADHLVNGIRPIRAKAGDHPASNTTAKNQRVAAVISNPASHDPGPLELVNL